MKEKFKKYIKDNQLFDKNEKMLLAISGGADSVALAQLLKRENYTFSFAHCNFTLRAEESDNDEVFVKNLANELGVKCFVNHFETKKYASEKKISVQMAARELRYNWFEKIRKENGFDYILTAHHRDDEVETFLINLIRGTGIRGMLGIKARRGQIIRPLLFFTKKEIYHFLQENNYDFIEDGSNADEKYMRNKIRLKLIPLFNDLNLAFSSTLSKEMSYLNEVMEVFDAEIEKKKVELLKKEKEGFSISIKGLMQLSPLQTYLYEMLNPFGFSEVNNIAKGLKTQSGKQFHSTTHRIIIDRERLFILPIKEQNYSSIQIEKSESEVFSPIHLRFNFSEDLTIHNDINFAILDYEKLHFPLELRKWEKGDFFFPLGMKGKKKLSDFFVDNKTSIHDKEQKWVLCSAGDIIWVVGMRIDERYKISDKTKKAYIVRLLKH